MTNISRVVFRVSVTLSFILTIFLMTAGVYASSFSGKLVAESDFVFDVEQVESGLTAEMEGVIDVTSSVRFVLEATSHASLVSDLSAELDLTRAYVDYSGYTSILRVGRQEINWGSGYFLNPTSVVNPPDLSRDPMRSRLPVWAALYEYDRFVDTTALGDGTLSVVYVPEQDTPLADMGVLFQNHRNKAEYAIKLTQRGIGAADVSVSHFSGQSDLPSPPEFAFQEVETYGLDIVGNIKSIGAWAEVAYHATEDLTKSGHELVIGGDYTFASGVHALVEYFHNEQMKLNKGYGVLMGSIDKYFGYNQIRINAMVGFGTEENAYLFNPEAKFSLRPALGLIVGATYAVRSGDIVLSQYLPPNAFYIDMEYSF